MDEINYGQSKGMSAGEALSNGVVGFIIATGIQVFAFGLYDISLPTYEAAGVVFLFTTTSTIRVYVIRRIFNAYHDRRTK